MKILCNETPTVVEATCLADVLVELGYATAHIATALNGEFIPRSEREDTVLKPGDHLDVVAPMQGG